MQATSLDKKLPVLKRLSKSYSVKHPIVEGVNGSALESSASASKWYVHEKRHL